ncbi:MAG: tRNA uridine-5-carboxymethylaminomethyl(34) synthesis GTPase MnmE [Bacteroidota bacterium]|nr:tRNA uridine-5-carboxymethylaminomethyl(34) synthesis GTPase MnmE [Bacteroidota bacterium]
MNSLLNLLQEDDTICALSTPNGSGAIAVIRLSGTKAFSICKSIFVPKNTTIDLEKAPSHAVYFGSLMSGDEIVDEVLLSLFRAPHSYNGEDIVEISCHGSVYIQQQIMQLLLNNGARLAKPGEYTKRAFLNGKMDLSQAEAVGDLIAANSYSSHHLAMQQMRGGFSSKIKDLRTQLVNFASLIELELDFSEEDVEFADRTQLFDLLDNLEVETSRLVESFRLGNVLKNGIPVAIVGKTNVGKSTLLNALLNEERAIVSDIPGTTRDTIEDTLVLNGKMFRFIDTAGLRDSEDIIENYGIERTLQKLDQAAIVLYVFDLNEITIEELNETLADLSRQFNLEEKKVILIGNKTDQLIEIPHHFVDLVEHETIFVSAKRKENINLIVDSLLKTVENTDNTPETIVTNVRHFEALTLALQDLQRVKQAFADKVPSDLIATDIRLALHHLGSITGEVTTDEILNNIFGNFCIGK